MSRHAYLIMAHHNFNQLYRLVKFLDSHSNDIYLHVDRKASGFNASIFLTACSVSKVFLMPRKSLAWGGDSLTRCEIDLLKAALPRKYDYYHLISGDDIPLRPLHDIDEFFQSHAGEEFISVNWDATNKPNTGIYNRIRYFSFFQNWVGRGSSGAKRFFWEIQLILKNIQKKCCIDRCRGISFKLGKGSQWFSVTHQFAVQIITYYESVLKKAFAFSCGSDELLVQTVILNSSEFMPRLSALGNMRLIDWSRSSDGCSPYTFTAEDFEMLISSDKLWARKVSEKVDSDLIQKIYQSIQ